MPTGPTLYVVDNSNAAVQALKAGTTLSESFNYTVFDGSLSDTAVLTITISGANDTATITVNGTPDSQVVEAGGSANATPGDPTASGDLDVVDVDGGEAKFQVHPAAGLAGTFGTFTFDADTGVWGYTLNNADPDTQALVAGQVVSESLEVLTLDGTDAETISVSITGANDAPVIDAQPLIMPSIPSVTLTAGDPDANESLSLHVGLLHLGDLENGVSTTVVLPVQDLAPVSGLLTVQDSHGLSTASDTFVSLGTNGADTLDHASLPDTAAIFGFGGNDNVSYDGSDLIIDGGADVDTLLIHGAAMIDLAVAADQSIGDRAVVTGFEHLEASASTESVSLSGDDGVNILKGGSAADTIVGRGGADLITGGDANDAIYGGAISSDDDNTTIDTAFYGEGTVVWNDADSVWEVVSEEGTDTLHGIEKLVIGSSVTWLVDQTANGGFGAIQDAIDASSDGDSIRVASATYAEMLTIDKEVNLLGPNAGIKATGATRNPEAIIAFPEWSTDGDALLYVATDTNNVAIDGFTLRSDDSLVSPDRFDTLIFTDTASNLSIKNNEMYGSTLALYVLTSNSQTVYRDGLLVEGNHIDGGPNVNSSFNRGMYIQATAGVIKDNILENTNIGIQYMPYAHVSSGLITGNTVSAGLIGLYHNYQNKGAAPVTWSHNTVTVAPNDRAGLETQVLGAWETPVTFRGLQAITFGTEGLATAAAPTVNFTANTVNATPSAGAIYNSTIFEGVRISTASAGARFNLEGNSFSGHTLEVNNGTANVYTLGSSPTFNDWQGADCQVKAGGTGNDVLMGTTASEILIGGSGNDRLTGDVGSDRLTGGVGNDRFIYLTALDSTAASKDVITDFKASGIDLIDFDALFSGSGSPGAITAASGALSGLANEFSSNRIAYFASAGLTQIYVDVDLNGAFNAAADLQLQLTGTPTLNTSDFIV